MKYSNVMRAIGFAELFLASIAIYIAVAYGKPVAYALALVFALKGFAFVVESGGSE